MYFYTGRHYGYFVDELYYLACSRHLDWGYVDQPPLIALIGWLVRVSLGQSLWAIRLLPALAGAAEVVLTALMAVTVLGLVAAALSTGTPRYAASAAVPGAVAVLCCVVFLVRLQAMKDQLTGGPVTGFDVSVSPGVGWFIALLASLAVCGFAVAELMMAASIDQIVGYAR